MSRSIDSEVYAALQWVRRGADHPVLHRYPFTRCMLPTSGSASGIYLLCMRLRSNVSIMLCHKPTVLAYCVDDHALIMGTTARHILDAFGAEDPRIKTHIQRHDRADIRLCALGDEAEAAVFAGIISARTYSDAVLGRSSHDDPYTIYPHEVI